MSTRYMSLLMMCPCGCAVQEVGQGAEGGGCPTESVGVCRWPPRAQWCRGAGSRIARNWITVTGGTTGHRTTPVPTHNAITKLPPLSNRMFIFGTLTYSWGVLTLAQCS